jgi:myo-inositol-1(or 4)-monophosphatase
MVELAKQAGAVIKDQFSSSGFTGRLKPDASIVTEADLASDTFISHQIQRNFPESLVLSEELHPDFTEDKKGNASTMWIIDPLDGTTNFSLGIPIWGVSIVRVEDGWPTETVHYFPIIQELYYATKGGGAWLNDQPIKVEDGLGTSTFFSCCSRTHQIYQVNLPYKTRVMGSASYSFCNVARGAALIGFEATPKIWDIAGAWLLVSEAGGIIETFDFSQPFPIQPGTNYRSHNFPTLATANERLMKKARRQIIAMHNGKIALSNL